MLLYVKKITEIVFVIFFCSPFIKAKLPILTENSWPVFLHGIDLPQTRVDKDVLIPYGIDLSEGLLYFIDWQRRLTDEVRVKGEPDALAKALLESNMNCKELFSPGTVYYRTYAMKGFLTTREWDRRNDRELELKPNNIFTNTQDELSRIRTCCNPTPPCVEKCFRVTEVKSARFTITAPNGLTKLMTGVCTYCAIKSCVSNCSEGEFATSNALLDAVIVHNIRFVHLYRL
jgi:hypothetical protein